MAATQSSFGIRHVTVVPTNFESSTDDEADESEESANSDPTSVDRE